jgi:UDP-N-acetylglucosamine--N-acetylmuramyl-(pentapeptide) pyrophosphoryl-undecaprenol N-acetylglucosamine transferase
MIQEQNSYAGLTNRKLGDKANTICVAYDGMEKYFPKEKIVITGNPVRRDILELSSKKEEARKHFNLTVEKPVVLVIGGSLGARTINNSILKDLSLFSGAGIQLLWQTGRIYFEEMSAKAGNTADLTDVRILEFIREMDLAYAAADVVISRAGALSISELCLAGSPVVFVPSPNVAEDHQTKNAKALTSRNAALMVTDADATEKLVPTAIELLKDEARRKELSKNIKALGKPRATEDIVNELEKLLV